MSNPANLEGAGGHVVDDMMEEELIKYLKRL